MVRQKPAKLRSPVRIWVPPYLTYTSYCAYILLQPPSAIWPTSPSEPLKCLKACDYILCEDTRHSRILFKHYAIQKPLKSFHKFNEAFREETIIADLEAGQNSCRHHRCRHSWHCRSRNASCRALHQRKTSLVVPIPGPSAPIAALSASGLNTERFQFIGFLPKTLGKLKTTLEDILQYPGTTICFESPQRLLKTLFCIHTLSPNRPLAIARELTKYYEEIRRGTSCRVR